MQNYPLIFLAVLGLIIVKAIVQLWLEKLNQTCLLARASSVPDSLKEVMDEETYARSVDYTLAKSRLDAVEICYRALVLLVLLTSGLLPWLYERMREMLGATIWSMSAYLFGVGLLISLLSLPFDWHSQFRLEERFGFNTTTQRTWWLDRIKGSILAILLGYPLLVLILKLVHSAGSAWWLWATALMLVFQAVMSVLAPVFILPLFNKLTPLPEGTLKERLFELSQRAGFQTAGIQVMDGSKRSRHSNAFFAGLGRFRRIVLFDTLLQHLNEAEVEAVLAHEIGHYKKRHIPKLLFASGLMVAISFYLVAWVADHPEFGRAFGFVSPKVEHALLLVGLLSGTFSFWLSPVFNWWSRKFEFEADAYATRLTGGKLSLITALRKLSEKNLSNLLPHPLYSATYYSHPTLLEREGALK